MIIQAPGLALPAKAQTGGTQTGAPVGFANELLISQLFPEYYALVKLGIVYFTVASAISPTAFAGGAAGVPIIGLYNPAASGKDLVIIATRLGIETTGTAAVTWSVNWWMGVSVLPTGTLTIPFNAYSLQQAGSVAKAFVNTAMTGSTAITGGPIPVLSGGLTATAAVTNVGLGLLTEDGMITVAPGNLAALGETSGALVAAKVHCAVLWAETPN